MLQVPLASVASLALWAVVPGARAQHDDAEIELAWRNLEPRERFEVAEWFRLELASLDTLVGKLVATISQRADVDPGFWPDAGVAPYFDPHTIRLHEPDGRGGARPFEPRRARTRLEQDSERAQTLRAALHPAEPKLWTYDFATRRLVRHGDPKDPERVLRAALAGRHPDLDYCIASVERMLDDGRLQTSFSAFAHAYAEPDGAVHPDVTLDDVLASGEALPIDGVDLLGIARWIHGEETPWVIPGDRDVERQLDRVVRARFREAEAWRAVVRGVARAFAVGEEHGGFVDDALLLHALWNSAESDPALLAPRLPGPAERERFFADWAETVPRERMRTKASQRLRALAGEGARIRALFGEIMVQFGAFEPRAAASAPVRPPAPEPSPVEPAEPAIEVDPAGEVALLQRLGKLERRRREALLERCVAAAQASGAIQVELVRTWVERAGIALADITPRPELGAHDAKVYGGGPPRRLVESGDRLWDRLIEQIEFEPAPPWPRRVDYEFATGAIVSVPSGSPEKSKEKPTRARAEKRDEEPDDLRDLRLLLRGVLPDQDLAMAAVAAALDARAGLRREAEFFAHLYSDRDGNAYAGITLADAWSSDFEFEVPDVDALAYIAKLWQDESVRPPLSQADHDRWYPRMGDSLRDLRTRVHVVRALAAVWFEGRPELAHGYDASIDILHATIAGCGEDAGQLVERLERDRSTFVQNALRDVSQRGNAGWNDGNARRDGLLRGARTIRRAVLGVLAQEGHLQG